MYHKKVCILGARAVGKTSLIRRFLGNDFSDDYAATSGADLSKIVLDIDGEKVQLMLWDIQGEENPARDALEYTRNLSAVIYVVDGTRLETLEPALELRQMVEEQHGSSIPSIMLFNKSDLAKDWEISSNMINDVENDGIFALLISSREGSGVNTAFSLITRVMLGKTTLIAA